MRIRFRSESIAVAIITGIVTLAGDVMSNSENWAAMEVKNDTL